MIKSLNMRVKNHRSGGAGVSGVEVGEDNALMNLRLDFAFFGPA